MTRTIEDLTDEEVRKTWDVAGKATGSWEESFRRTMRALQAKLDRENGMAAGPWGHVPRCMCCASVCHGFECVRPDTDHPVRDRRCAPETGTVTREMFMDKGAAKVLRSGPMNHVTLWDRTGEFRERILITLPAEAAVGKAGAALGDAPTVQASGSISHSPDRPAAGANPARQPSEPAPPSAERCPTCLSPDPAMMGAACRRYLHNEGPNGRVDKFHSTPPKPREEGR